VRAYEVSLKLIAKVPDDPNLLFIMQIAHEGMPTKRSGRAGETDRPGG